MVISPCRFFVSELSCSDLGCGCGLSTLLLTQKYGAKIFAAALWISPTKNYERFKFIGIDDKAVPIFY
jgi:cyclopropane fatty-acyl-phospholipid synthase-like methyltransferase